MALHTEVRNFRGKDVTVVFAGIEYEGTQIRAEVFLVIDGAKFSGIGYQSNCDKAYEKAVSNLEHNLMVNAQGTNVDSAKTELSWAQKHLNECEQKKVTAQWFLDFTKDKING